MNKALPTSCLNCETPLEGAYCHQCGQQNLPLKLSVLQLLVIFFGEFFNYDGLLSRSIRLLITSPAGLTLAYMQGKRIHYVNPVRFYLFTSALFFLFITYLVPTYFESFPSNSTAQLSSEHVDESTSEPLAKVVFDTFFEGKEVDSIGGGVIQVEFSSNSDSLAHQATLASKDLPADRVFQVDNEFTKRLPQFLLLTLPLMALVSKLVFFRRRHYWYIDHLIFVLHLATSLFFLLFVQLGIEVIEYHLPHQDWYLVRVALALGWLGYAFLCFKRFFEKTWTKSLLLFLWMAFLQTNVLIAGQLFVLSWLFSINN